MQAWNQSRIDKSYSKSGRKKRENLPVIIIIKKYRRRFLKYQLTVDRIDQKLVVSTSVERS